eukprot:2530517-Pyramimonas_sp.AAC.1
MAPPHQLTRFVAPKQAQPKAPEGSFAWCHRTQAGAPLTRFGGPIRSSTEGPVGRARMTPPHPL